jgi:murein DD-endopeptidase MepM/ murein hydrolase activator NlpD
VAVLSCSLSMAAGIAVARTADGGGVSPGGGGGGGSHGHGIFPVRGPHTYGDGLGAGRGHQGQDLLAKCGTKVVAAVGGRVYYRKFQSAAGNYVVINLRDGRSMVYEHLLHPGVVHRGQRVRTGQKLGLVGQTGDATACHLHFELWSKPGWYKGGSVLNPTPLLKAWDKRS